MFVGLMTVSLMLLSPPIAKADPADLDAGGQAFNRGNYAAAIREWMPLAEKGHIQAQYLLGQMYDDGKGVPEDDAVAVKWYRKAAEQGHPKAQFYLGLMYDRGQGIPFDPREAARWYRKAAEQEHPEAQLNLGRKYASGKGCRRTTQKPCGCSGRLLSRETSTSSMTLV